METKNPCSVEDCPHPVKHRGLCGRHYDRERRYGDPLAGGPMRANRGSRSTCSVEGCDGTVVGRGLCGKCWQRWRKYGDPLIAQSRGQGRGVPAEKRFWASIRKTPDGHWLWTRPPNNSGYGTLTVDGRTVSAHRFAWELLKGPVPEGHEPDHQCEFRHCCNPDCLEIVTTEENRRRAALTNAAKIAARPACKHGHPWRPETTYVNRAGSRVCLV